MPIFGTGIVDLAAGMGGAYAIQTLFIPVLKQNPNLDKYALYTLIAYCIGISIYIYIAYSGSFGTF